MDTRRRNNLGVGDLAGRANQRLYRVWALSNHMLRNQLVEPLSGELVVVKNFVFNELSIQAIVRDCTNERRLLESSTVRM